jgi:hypothetical protein
VSAVPTLEEMAQKIADARERLATAERKVEELRGPYHAATGRAQAIRDEIEAMEQGMESSKRAHMTLLALQDVSLTYDGELVVPIEVYRGHDMYFLVAVGQDGTGLYLHTPKRSHRYQGKTYAVRIDQAQSHGVEPSSGYQKLRDAGLMEWETRGKDQWGRSGQGSAGAVKPLPPPEGGRWKWLKVREQEALEAA